MISFAPNGAWADWGSDFPMAYAMGYDLSPTSRACWMCNEFTLDKGEFTFQQIDDMPKWSPHLTPAKKWGKKGHKSQYRTFLHKNTSK